MHIEELIGIVEGEVIQLGDSEENTVERAFASDLMSDVLTLSTDSLLLITGMANMQTIRTAEMAEIKNILFVRGKKPTEEMLQLARHEKINLYTTRKSMFATCGQLHQAGLKPVY
ncbi:MAG: hypothetical protein IPM71_11315 [Bacteroidota bacterium]|nr:MAG: hypothetical protein IPM71_11315 [Bacteroidota bacterium]